MLLLLYVSHAQNGKHLSVYFLTHSLQFSDFPTLSYVAVTLSVTFAVGHKKAVPSRRGYGFRHDARRWLDAFDDRGYALAAADAERDERGAEVAPLKLVKHCAKERRPGGA